ncbi:tyrosine-type recombinase/integrase [uncultured Ilyobacter sp.]|uniref:tyrosine-type recombinase/integrase n=1 Tax=uncultured Ilyobacter sp. TaxID=544433 RepID=UPI003748E8E7
MFFLNELGGKLSSVTVNWCFRNYGKKAGINGRCSPHVFRHTFATNFIRKGGMYLPFRGSWDIVPFLLLGGTFSWI